MVIRSVKYKDITAYEVETLKWSALFSAEYGGKMLSLVYKQTGRQILEETIGEVYKKPFYDGVYIDAECSAFDDMFPTIDRMICEQYPWVGTVCPDHGEVYALPWQSETDGDSLHLWVYSPRFCYRLDKWVRDEKGAIKVDYCASNLGPFPFDFIYAAHCMLKAENGARLELPFVEGSLCTTTFNTNAPELGSYGNKITWPTQDGFDLTYTYPKSRDLTFKVYFDQRISDGMCSYHYPDGLRLDVSFSNDTLPYFALWTNLGNFKNMYNIAIEPCSGSFDRPDLARKHGQYSVLEGNGKYSWFIAFDMQEDKVIGYALK